MNGKVVYVGIDVDDIQYHASVLIGGRERVLSFQCRPTLRGLTRQLNNVRKHVGGIELIRVGNWGVYMTKRIKDLCRVVVGTARPGVFRDLEAPGEKACAWRFRGAVRNIASIRAPFLTSVSLYSSQIRPRGLQADYDGDHDALTKQ